MIRPQRSTWSLWTSSTKRVPSCTDQGLSANPGVGCPACDFVPGPQVTVDRAIVVLPEIRRRTAGGFDDHDPAGTLLVGGPETARAFGHHHARREWVHPGCLEQLRSEVRSGARRDH